MTFDPAILRELAVGIDVTGYLRIMDARFRHEPTGTGVGMSRFSSPADRFTLLYVAQDLQTALAERVIRDRFQGRQRRVLFEEEISTLVVASTVAKAPLKLLDLRTSGASRLGLPTDAVRGRAQQAGRRFSQRLHDATDFDGIVYMSRITNAECVAVYDRAIDAYLDPDCPVVKLQRLATLASSLRSLNITMAR